METVKGDLHVHTKYSREPRMFHLFKTLPFYSPEDVIKKSINRGMKVVTVTEHDTIKGAEIGEKIAKKKYKDIIFVKGEEVSTREGHVIALGIEETIRPGLPAAEAIELIRKQGGVSIAAHPFTVYGLGPLIFNLKLNGVEVLNPWASIVNANKIVCKLLPKLNLAPIGSTDAHASWIIGRIFTKMRVKSFSVDGVLDAIRKKRTFAGTDLNAVELIANLFQGMGISIAGIGR